MKRSIRMAFAIIGIGGLLIIIGILMGGSVKKTFYDDYLSKEWRMDEDDEKLSMDDENTNITLSTDTNETLLTASTSALTRLKVDVSYVTLRIEPHDRQNFTYSITDNSKRIDASVYVEGNTLTISTKNNRKWNWFSGWKRDRLGRSKTTITVKIPQNTLFDTADINIGAGLLMLDGFTANQRFKLNTGAGKADVKNITASNVNIQIGVGETAFHNCSFTDTVMNTGIGETVFDGNIFKKLELDAGIGEIDMRIHGKRDDYAIDIISGIGAVLVNGTSGNRLMENIVKENNRIALHVIRIKAGIGEVDIKFIE